MNRFKCEICLFCFILFSNNNNKISPRWIIAYKKHKPKRQTKKKGDSTFVFYPFLTLSLFVEMWICLHNSQNIFAVILYFSKNKNLKLKWQIRKRYLPISLFEFFALFYKFITFRLWVVFFCVFVSNNDNCNHITSHYWQWSVFFSKLN